MPTEYFFVSDLHIGGDEQLKLLDFEDDFIAFLEMLEQREGDTELVIIGDAFGLWEFTTAEGVEKFDLLVSDHTRLFEQFERTGEHVTITLIPGNHDYELACYPRFVERLGEYGIVLEQKVSITRKLGGKKIWIEHGMQRDPSNHMPDFGNPHANPVGYFVTHSLVGTERVGERVVINTGTWLKKLERVPARSRLLPSVYRPSFRLNYFCLSEDEGRITIDYERIRKSPPRELSLLQRLVARKAQRDALEDIPERTVIG